MASKEMAARLAAKMTAEAGPVEASADATGGIGADESNAPAAESVAESEAPLSPVNSDSATVSAALDTPEQIEAKARAARLALYEQKLKERREKVQSDRALARARAAQKAADEDRRAAAEEKKKYDGLKLGTMKETLEALGRDPRQVWEEMNKEAIEASTPEAQARRDREAIERAFNEKLTPLQQEVERLRAREAEVSRMAHEQALVSSFSRELADPAFKDLRIEYSDEALLEHAQHYDRNPDQLRAAAREYGVRLTAPERGFTMHELLQVLSAAQAAHNAGVQARRAAQSPAEPQSAPRTVNGTAPRRNAETAIGNELASQRASSGPATPSLSVKERLHQRTSAEIRRSGG